MPIRQELRSFWWFREQRIGGMGQPGFNPLVPAYDEEFTPQEKLIHSWIARLPNDRVPLSDLSGYLAWWRSVVIPFHGTPTPEFDRDAAQLLERGGFLNAIDRVNEKTGIVSAARWDGIDDPHLGVHLEVQVDSERIRAEVEVLRRNDFSVLVAMTEYAPHPTVRESDLDVHHFPVGDTTPPRREQVEAFAELLDRVYTDDLRMVVHCMAGIGRTTTILLAGHLLRGERLGPLFEVVQVANPHFRAHGEQWAFIEGLADELGLR